MEGWVNGWVGHEWEERGARQLFKSSFAYMVF